MKNTIRLFIALGFAAFAAILNFLWVQQNLPKYGKYTVYTADVAQGAVIDSEQGDFQSITLPEKKDVQLSKFLVPWDDRSTLVGFKASRPIKAGELALSSDMTTKNVTPEFSTLGPFRLLSVRDQFVNNTSRDSGSSGGVVGRIPVTLVVPKQINSKTGLLTYDPKIKQLLYILELDKLSGNKRETSIMAIVAMSGSQNDQTPRNGPVIGDDEMALVIDLPDIPVITDVLLNNTSPEIGFVVPASLIDSSR